MSRMVASLALAMLGASCGGAGAAVTWTCEVLQATDLGASGRHEPDATSRYIGNRFTASDETGAVTGPNLGESRDWKAVPRRFGADQDALQTMRASGGRTLMHLYVETFATGPTKPFLLTELDIGATRTGTCRAAP